MESAIVTGIFGIIGIALTYILTINKNNKEVLKLKAEIDKINLENESAKTEITENLLNFYRTEINNLLGEVNKLNVKVSGLSTRIDDLTKTIETQNTSISQKDKTIDFLKTVIEKSKLCTVPAKECPVRKTK